jgi:putative ABC transport system substrate-binding protein
MDRRRFLLTSLAGVLATPVAGAAQRVPEVGLLAFGTKRLSLYGERGMHELREALRGFGWIDGQSIRLRSQFADLNEDRLATLAQEFVHRRVDVILAIGTPATEAARRATMSIPIVMSGSADPIAAGLARNLVARRSSMSCGSRHLVWASRYRSSSTAVSMHYRLSSPRSETPGPNRSSSSPLTPSMRRGRRLASSRSSTGCRRP